MMIDGINQSPAPLFLPKRILLFILLGFFRGWKSHGFCQAQLKAIKAGMDRDGAFGVDNGELSYTRRIFNQQNW